MTVVSGVMNTKGRDWENTTSATLAYLLARIVLGQACSMLGSNYAINLHILNIRIQRSIKVAEAYLYQQNMCRYTLTNPAAIAYKNLLKEMMKNAKNA